MTDKTQSRRIRVLPEQWARVEKAASGTRQNPNELPGLARHGGPRSARTVRQRRQGSHRACTAVCRSRRCPVVAWPAPDGGRHRRGHGMQRRDADVDGRGGRPRGSTVSVRPDRSETRPPSASSVSQEFRWSNFAGERPEQTESANNSRDRLCTWLRWHTMLPPMSTIPGPAGATCALHRSHVHKRFREIAPFTDC